MSCSSYLDGLWKEEIGGCKTAILQGAASRICSKQHVAFLCSFPSFFSLSIIIKDWCPFIFFTPSDIFFQKSFNGFLNMGTSMLVNQQKLTFISSVQTQDAIYHIYQPLHSTYPHRLFCGETFFSCTSWSSCVSPDKMLRYIIIFTTPSAQAGYDTRSIF